MERVQKRNSAQKVGMLVEDGILLGVGETISDRADSILAMKLSGVDQVRVMSFVPQSQTPLASIASPDRKDEYLFISVMRLVMPDRLIPASLDVDGIKGLKMRLHAGANVVTSIIPPSNALAGVSQSTLDIDQGLRTVFEVRRVLKGIGLHIASLENYQDWISHRKAQRFIQEVGHDQSSYYRGTASGDGSCIFSQTSPI